MSRVLLLGERVGGAGSRIGSELLPDVADDAVKYINKFGSKNIDEIPPDDLAKIGIKTDKLALKKALNTVTNDIVKLAEKDAEFAKLVSKSQSSFFTKFKIGAGIIGAGAVLTSPGWIILDRYNKLNNSNYIIDIIEPCSMSNSLPTGMLTPTTAECKFLITYENDYFKNPEVIPPKYITPFNEEDSLFIFISRIVDGKRKNITYNMLPNTFKSINPTLDDYNKKAPFAGVNPKETKFQLETKNNIIDDNISLQLSSNIPSSIKDDFSKLNKTSTQQDIDNFNNTVLTTLGDSGIEFGFIKYNTELKSQENNYNKQTQSQITSTINTINPFAWNWDMIYWIFIVIVIIIVISIIASIFK